MVPRIRVCPTQLTTVTKFKMTIALKAFAALSSIIGSCGIIFNFLVCLVYITHPKLLDAPNIFIINISIGDLMYSIVALPMLVTSNVHGEWVFGEAGCTAYGFLTTFFALGSMMNLAGVAYERYVTLCKLYDNGEAQFSQRKALLLSSVLWCYSFFLSVFPVLGWSSYVQEGVGTSCSIDWRSREINAVSYALCLICACFVLPVTVIIFCFYKSYKALRRLTEQARQNWGENVRVTQDTIAAERKVASVAVTITTGFLVAWTPYTISSILGMYDPGLVSDLAASIPAYIAKSSACYNPLIYMFMYKRLRNGLVNVLCCKKTPVHPADVANGTSLSAQTRQRTNAGETPYSNGSQASREDQQQEHYV